MIEIRIITTIGCEGCRIMENIVNNVIKDINYDEIEYSIYDFQNLDVDMLHFVNRYQVNDFPTTFIIKDNNVLNRIEGTVSKNTMIRYIDDALCIVS